MKIGYEGRHVVVTGGTGELGAAVVAELLEAGAMVHAACRSAAKPGPLASLRRAELRLVDGIDLKDEQAVRRFYEALPGLWASIHSAGGFAMSRIEETSMEDFRKMMETNAASCFEIGRAHV